MDNPKTNAKHLSQKEQYGIRKNIIRLLKQGKAPKDVAGTLGVSTQLVYKTRKDYNEKGAGGIRAQKRGRRTGEKRKLAPGQEKAIRRAIIDRSPEQLGLKCRMWTRKAIQEYIRREFRVSVPPSTLGCYLGRWGFSIQGPPRRADRRGEAGLKAWMDGEYPDRKSVV
jgi:transposase